MIKTVLLIIAACLQLVITLSFLATAVVFATIMYHEERMSPHTEQGNGDERRRTSTGTDTTLETVPMETNSHALVHTVTFVDSQKPKAPAEISWKLPSTPRAWRDVLQSCVDKAPSASYISKDAIQSLAQLKTLVRLKGGGDTDIVESIQKEISTCTCMLQAATHDKIVCSANMPLLQSRNTALDVLRHAREKAEALFSALARKWQVDMSPPAIDYQNPSEASIRLTVYNTREASLRDIAYTIKMAMCKAENRMADECYAQRKRLGQRYTYSSGFEVTPCTSGSKFLNGTQAD
jgi:hypothetical protein